MYFGVDYYPEQWVYPYAGTADKPESRWAEDAELMLAAGVNVVRMGEFSWGICEPEEGKYDFGWLNRAMDVMKKAGIKVVLGTPTAAPPIWLAKKFPEILPVDDRGRTRHEGITTRLLPEQRRVLGIIRSASRARNGRGAGQASAAHRLAD